MPKKPNVILLSIDALRADFCGFVDKKSEKLTPNLNALAKECAVFENAFATGPETPWAFPGIFTSTYPFDFHQDPRKKGFSKEELKEFVGTKRKLLSELLHDNGYATAAFNSNILISEHFGYDRGWDYFECLSSSPGFLTPEFLVHGKRRFKDKIIVLLRGTLSMVRFVSYKFYPKIWLLAKYHFYKRHNNFPELVNGSQINALGSDFVSAQEGGASPFFLWLHYMDVHIPYYSSEGRAPGDAMGFEEFLGRYAPDNFQNSIANPAVRKLAEQYVDSTRKIYGERVSAADRKVGDFLKVLKERGLYDDALIILTADHGDEFMEHGGLTHSAKLYNELLHVPLLVKLPHGKFERITKKVSMIDLPTTICDVLGVERPKTYRGVNLFKDTRELMFHEASSPDMTVYGCQNDDWKYILTMPGGKEELYNLKNDPGEKKNLAATEREVAKKMRSGLVVLHISSS